MELYVLGAGTPDAHADRYGSAFVLRAGGELLMVDCGPAATYKLARCGMRPTDIHHLLFTHHHFDHNADYPCFALTRWDIGAQRIGPLYVYGPPPTAAITDRLFGDAGAFVYDWRARVEHPVSQRMFTDRGGTLPRPAPAIRVREVADGDRIDGGGWTARVARLTHAEPWLASVGYRIETEEGVTAVVNDAGPDDAMVELGRDADLLVMACAFDSEYAADHPEVPPMITGTEDAGRIAQRAGAKTAVLVHCNRGVAAPGRRERAVVEVARHFSGRIILADELMRIRP